MVDAGSTGSRIHVYKFKQCTKKDALQFEDEVLFKITIPGLSAYQPKEAAESLDELLDAAMEKVPTHLQKKTPVSIKATAGLRLLGNEQSEAILDAVYDRLVKNYPFVIVGGRQEGVTIMEGRDEGVYAWITVNSLLGRLGTSTTAAIFDLGGGSTQIVFEPEQWENHEQLDNAALPASDHKYYLQHNGHTHLLYQHSYLGYGLMEARKRVHQHTLSLSNDPQHHHHPCLPNELQWAHSITINKELQEQQNHNVTFIGKGILSECKTVIDQVLNKDAMCEVKPCSFDGIHQPTIADSFKHGPIYIFSYFFDRTQPLGLPAQFKLPELEALTEKVCSGEYLEMVTDPDLRFELLDRPEWCLDLTYIYRLLSYGYEIPDDKVIHIAKKIDGVETGWCLGAAISMLDEFSSS
ncbi:nucleoside phosphatase GDA1/CD39 [Cunninghamella echinulata]|nr:nucleoside phosphatase GDA1/CD39 [Cunninghamella echinulata]